MSKLVKVWAAGLFLSTLTLVIAAEPTLEWAETYNNGGKDGGYGIALDGEGYIYVAGGSEGASNDDVRLLKYNSGGSLVWSRGFDRGHADEAHDVAVDSDGNIYLVGTSSSGVSDDCLIMKYSSQGDTLWTRFPAAGLPTPDVADEGTGIAVDENYVYVTGSFDNSGETIIRTLVYDKDGGFIKVENYNSPDSDFVWGIALDAQSNVYIAGSSGNDYLIIKYTSELDEVWSIPYDAGDVDAGTGIAVDRGGNVFVTGVKGVGLDNSDICTVCFDSAGDFRWSKTYNSYQADGDLGYGIAADENYVYVVGTSIDTVDTITGFRTICYDKDGNLIWNTFYPDTGTLTIGLDIAADPEGFLYLTGIQDIFHDGDMLTLKYATNAEVSEQLPESPLSLDVIDSRGSSVTLRYEIPSGTSGAISFYSADGRLLEGFRVSSGESLFSWNTHNTPCGVYFAVLESETQSVVTKFVLLR